MSELDPVIAGKPKEGDVLSDGSEFVRSFPGGHVTAGIETDAFGNVVVLRQIHSPKSGTVHVEKARHRGVV